jgi:FkbM family methyltransferase
MLLPFLKAIHGEHHKARGPGLARTGGFIDVGANVGDVSEAMLATFTDHARRFYLHHLAPPAGDPRPPLVDAVHGIFGTNTFHYALEPSAATRALLQRRAEAGLWEGTQFRLFPIAATNTTGSALFCSLSNGGAALAGSEQGGIFASSEAAARAAAGVAPSTAAPPGSQAACQTLPTVTLAHLVDVQGELTRGRSARVFLLKVDVEGAEAVVLAGAEPLLAAKRISYLIFENHAKWRATQEAMGLPSFVSVGAVVARLGALGYACHYVSPWGLVPFEVPGTPGGDAPRPGCSEGLPFCARWRLYDRQFWSNVLCAASPEEDASVQWLGNALVNPSARREELLCGEQQKEVCSKLL